MGVGRRSQPERRARLFLRLVTGLAFLWTVGTPSAGAQSGPFLEWANEISFVSVGAADTTWQVTRLAGGVQQEGRFGWVLRAERHRRGDLVDWAGQADAFRRAGAWTVRGAVAFAPSPDFLYRRSLEGELAREIGGGFVVHGGYRHLRFRAVSVHIVEPAVSWYFGPHDVQARGFLVRNVTTDQRATTVLLHGSIEASPRIRLRAGAAVGSRIFDVTAFEETDAEAWVAFASVRVRVTPRVSVELGAGRAHEDPLFAQRTLSAGLRWTF